MSSLGAKYAYHFLCKWMPLVNVQKLNGYLPSHVATMCSKHSAILLYNDQTNERHRKDNDHSLVDLKSN